jgi:regulator of protease activity HflC (stomatin/prohibitin superfamily)
MTQPAARFVQRLTVGSFAVVLALALLLAPGSALTSHLAFLPLGAALIFLAGLLGVAIVARTRGTFPERAGWYAQMGQIVAVSPMALAGAALAWFGRMGALPAGGYAPAIAMAAVMFAVLLMERFLAAMPSARLPEAPALRALARVVLLAGGAACVLQLGASFDVGLVVPLAKAASIFVAFTGLEIAVRAVGRIFSPRPALHDAQGACSSWLASCLDGGLRDPIRTRLGLDFTRSWAIGYVRATFWPMVAFFCCLSWGLSGVAVVPLDARAVYERFGVPVRVLHAGLHLVLPWPMGRLYSVEFGAMHDIGLIGSDAPMKDIAAHAEGLAPASADRLWERPHAGEIGLVIASTGAGQQSFQTVSADVRLVYRVGLQDRQAIDSITNIADPQAFVRDVAGRVMTASFAGRTLDETLGGAREKLAESLRAAMQAEFERARCGLDMVAVVIEAIHPPPGAADAYHAVRAAEIAAQAAISSERGNAIVIHAQARQYEDGTVSAARASADETVEAARTVSLRFAADRDASEVGGKAFTLERYFSNLVSAIAKTPKTIIDHRLDSADTSVLDLRPPAAAIPSRENAE